MTSVCAAMTTPLPAHQSRADIYSPRLDFGNSSSCPDCPPPPPPAERTSALQRTGFICPDGKHHLPAPKTLRVGARPHIWGASVRLQRSKKKVGKSPFKGRGRSSRVSEKLTNASDLRGRSSCSFRAQRFHAAPPPHPPHLSVTSN